MSGPQYLVSLGRCPASFGAWTGTIPSGPVRRCLDATAIFDRPEAVLQEIPKVENTRRAPTVVLELTLEFAFWSFGVMSPCGIEGWQEYWGELMLAQSCNAATKNRTTGILT